MPDLLAEITATARAYFAQVNELPLTATDFYSWLDELPVAQRVAVLARGLPASRTEPDFLRYCLEVAGPYDARLYGPPPFSGCLRAVGGFRPAQRRPAAP